MIELSIIIPVFNEKNTILTIINKINNLDIKKQIIVVDDFSNDGTKEVLYQNQNKIDLLLCHKKNLGKGKAIQTAQKHVLGKYTIIQDGDLEYEPLDYLKILNCFKKNEINVVYGSRVLGKNRYNSKNFISLSRVFFNHLLTIFSNILNNQKLTDAHTCYKAFSSELFKNIILEENGFAFCPEITTKISNLNIEIKEVPISYNGRNYNEGKKISYIDGIQAIYVLIKYKFFSKSTIEFNNK